MFRVVEGLSFLLYHYYSFFFLYTCY